MRPHSTDNFYKRLCHVVKTTAFTVLLLAAAGYLQFIFYAHTSNMEWAGECDDVYLLFDGDNLSNARFIFVAHTPFGERMLTELLEKQTRVDRSLISLRNDSLFLLAANNTSLHKLPYLDYYAVAHLRALRFFRKCRGFIWPQQ